MISQNEDNETPRPDSDEATIHLNRAEDSQTTTIGSRSTNSRPSRAAIPKDRPGPAQYEIRGELGRGGMGIVFDAWDARLRREVALKVMSYAAPARSEEVGRFVEEARVQGNLEHPGICPVHDFGVDERGRPWFAMKKVRGRSLRSVLRESEAAARPSPLGRLLDDFARVCEAVAYAHSRGVIHRDLKPGNVMIGAFGEVQVMDWGLSRIIETAARRELEGSGGGDEFSTENGMVVGTPAYMPPEQAEGRLDALDERSDVYGLGAILYRILTGKPPHLGEDRSELLAKVRNGVVSSCRDRAPERRIPVELESIAMKCLARDPDQRYQSVGELAEEISAWRDHRRVGAASFSPLRSFRNWIRRNRGLAIFAATALLVFLVTVLYQNHRDSQDEQSARESMRAAQQERIDTHVVQIEAARAQWTQNLSEERSVRREANGELVAAAVARWFASHDELIERIDEWERVIEQGRRQEDRSPSLASATVYRDLRRRVIRSASLEAAELGGITYARSWASRGHQGRRQLLDEIQSVRKEQVRRDRDAVESGLARARRPAEMKAGFLDYAANAIARLGRPEVVRRLLDEDCLRSEAQWVRLLVLESLGRIGDARTKGRSGRDAVKSLCKRLFEIDLEADLEEAVVLVGALALIGDDRAFECVFDRRMKAGSLSSFWRRTEAILPRLPLPAEVLEPKTAAQFLRRGLFRSERGENEAALQDYDRALAEDPKLVEAYGSRAVLHFEARRYSDAEDDQGRAIGLAPKVALHHYGRANARLKQKKLVEALGDYDRALALDENFSAAYNGRGRCHEEAGRMEEAFADYERALVADSNNADALNNRGIIHYKSGRLTAALSDYDRAIQLRPERPLPHNNRGLCLAKMGRLEDAVASYTQSLRVDPTSILAYNNRGLSWLRLERPERALSDYSAALEVAPRVPALWYNRSLAHRAAADWKAALADLNQALDLVPNSSLYLGDRASARQELGDHSGAREDLQKALALATQQGGPESARVLALRERLKTLVP